VTVDNLGSRILTLVTRLSGRDEPGPGTATTLDRAATEAAYRRALTHWFELTAQGPDADRTEVDSVLPLHSRPTASGIPTPRSYCRPE